MARTLLSFQPTDEDQRLQDYLSGGSAPLGDPQATPEAPPAPDDTTQQDPTADASTAQPQPDPTPAPAPAAQPMAAAPQPSQQDQLLQQLMASRGNAADPELTARWRKEEMGALDRADALRNQSYGGWESLRDVLPAIAPTILDIGFNKGRGLSGIVSATAQAAGQNEADHKAEIAKADDYALRLHQQRAAGHQVDPVTQMLAIGRLGVAQQNAGTGAKRVQGTEDWRGQQANPDSAYRTTQVTQAGRTRTASEQALLDTQHENNPRTAADKAAIEAAQTGAQIQTQLGYAPQQADAAAMKAGAEARARIAPNVEQAGGEARARVLGQREGEAANRPAPAGYAVTDDLRYQNTVGDPKERAKMDADATTSRQLLMASQGLAASRKQNGPQWLPSADSGEYQALHLAVVGAANRVIADAGTLNAGERQYIENIVPGVTPNWKDFAGWMANSDLNAQQLEGFAKGLQRVIDSRMMGYGLGVASPAQTTPAPAQSAADGGGHGESLGPPQSMAPKVNDVMGAPPPPTALHHIQKPNGKVIETMLPPQQLQGLPAGWKVID